MSSEVFPSTITEKYGGQVEHLWRTIITDFESGKEQRQRRWAFPKRRLTLPYGAVAEDRVRDFWKFYMERCGAWDTFYFYFREMRHWYGEYIARATGALATFDLPSKETLESSLEVKLDGVVTGVTFISGGGAAGSDRIQFATNPAEGALITASFYGKFRLYGRFEADKLTDETFRYMLYNLGIAILEVKQ